MPLAMLREALKRTLATENIERLFIETRRADPVLAAYLSITAVVEVLADRAAAGYEAQERLLRALLAADRRTPGERLWRTILLYAFLPSLIRLRRRTAGAGVRDDDLDSTVWVAFCEVLASYPLSRPGSVAAGLVLDTSKRYFKELRQQQHARRAADSLVDYAKRAQDRSPPNEPVAVGFDLADHQEREADAPDPDELMAMREALVRRLGTRPRAELDIDLIWATRIDGMTVREYMVARGIATGADDNDRLAESRLWRQRLRVEGMLYAAVRGRERRAATKRSARSRFASGGCPVSPELGFSLLNGDSGSLIAPPVAARGTTSGAGDTSTLMAALSAARAQGEAQMASTLKKIAIENVCDIVGRALLDAEFRVKLRDDAKGTLMILGYDSSDDSAAFFKTLVSQSFQSVAVEVESRMGGRPVIALWF